MSCLWYSANGVDHMAPGHWVIGSLGHRVTVSPGYRVDEHRELDNVLLASEAACNILARLVYENDQGSLTSWVIRHFTHVQTLISVNADN